LILMVLTWDLFSLSWIAVTTFISPPAELADPRERATRLAKGISEMMNCHAAAVVVTASLAPVLGILTLIWKFRWRK